MARSNPIWWSLFINEYLKNGQNGVKAMIKARPDLTEGSAKVYVTRLFSRVNFLKVYEKSKSDLEAKIGITKDQWIKKVKEACERDWQRIEESYDQMGPAADPIACKCLTQARKTVNEMMRQALCIPDVATEVNHSGSIDMNFKLTEENGSRLRDIRKNFPLPNFGHPCD